MPTAMRSAGFRFFFYSNEGDQPPHIHVERQGSTAKFWLAPVESARSTGMSDVDMRRAHRLVMTNQEYLREVWHEFFGS